MRFLLCSVTGVAVVLLHSRVSFAQTTSEEPAPIEITAPTADDVARAGMMNASRAAADTERPPAEHQPSRAVRVAVERPRDPSEHGPPMGILGAGTAVLVLAQLFPFIVAANSGNYWYVFPIVPEAIDGVRYATAGGLGGLAAGFEFGCAAVQAAGLAMSIAGSVMREHGSAPRPNTHSIFSWNVVPQVTPTGAGVVVAVVNW